MLSPWDASHVEKTRSESRHSWIFANDECVARMPPMAALLLPWPGLAN